MVVQGLFVAGGLPWLILAFSARFRFWRLTSKVKHLAGEQGQAKRLLIEAHRSDAAAICPGSGASAALLARRGHRGIFRVCLAGVDADAGRALRRLLRCVSSGLCNNQGCWPEANGRMKKWIPVFSALSSLR